VIHGTSVAKKSFWTNYPGLFWISIAVSGLLISLQLLRWPLTEILTVFLEPLLELIVWILFIVFSVVVIVYAIRRRKTGGTEVWFPFSICLATMLFVIFVPFNSFYLKFNFKYYEFKRTAAAQQILAGGHGQLVRSGGRGDLILLPDRERALSVGGGEVMVDHREGKTYILFFTFRGILDHFSGYVYSPSDTPPAQDQFLGRGLEVYRVAPNWYWYASS
jgi:hypothetical protein